MITRPYAEYALGAVCLRTRVNMQQPYRLVRVEFTHSRPASIREHERIFACPVVFGAEACQLVIDRHAWDAPRTDAGRREDPVGVEAQPRPTMVPSAGR